MSHVYTARARVRHHEVDAFGRATPATYLRLLAQLAIDASSDAGFDAAWYAAACAHWLVRRSTFAIRRHVRADAELVMRTWVEDFRRVLSARRYDVCTAGGAPVLEAVTDWVYVDTTTGRIRRIPEVFERGFGTAVTGQAATGTDGARTPGAAAPVLPPHASSLASPARTPFRQPRPPAEPARSRCRVRWSELDALAHVNNAAYLDILVQAVLDALDAHGWPIERLAGGGTLPGVQAGDLEYLEAAVYGEELETRTWFTPAEHGLDAHQRIVRAGDGRPRVQATSAWRWLAAEAGEPVPLPAGLPEALRPLVAA